MVVLEQQDHQDQQVQPVFEEQQEILVQRAQLD
jgi:hypothetical protein